MFPGPDPTQRPETPAERDARRARTGVDRHALKQVAIAMTLIFGTLAGLVAADVAGVERRLTKATVIGLSGSTSRSRGCITELSTGFGDTKIYTRLPCDYAPWRIGDAVEVEARRLRFTGAIVVQTKGTIFAGAESVLPESW